MSDFLTLLPTEIRNAIHEYALLRSEVDPYGYEFSVHARTITGEESGESSSPSRHDPQIISDNRSTGGSTSPVRKTWMPQTINPHPYSPSTALLCLVNDSTSKPRLWSTLEIPLFSLILKLVNASTITLRDTSSMPLQISVLTHGCSYLGWVRKSSFLQRRLYVSYEAWGASSICSSSLRPKGNSGRFGRGQISVLLDGRWQLSSDVDRLSVSGHLSNANDEVLFDYQHSLDVECGYLSGRRRRSMRDHGTVKLFINGSKTLGWEQACA